MRAVGRKTESQSGLKPGSHSNEKHECILIFKSKKSCAEGEPSDQKQRTELDFSETLKLNQ